MGHQIFILEYLADFGKCWYSEESYTGQSAVS